ncbi:hypothetical protein BDB01DRAFT_812045 [Pilobolus umbonatus]|nr:hypothetical protein BDB01DRAFT_812045 [Pilobolus umbonatus]
MLSLTGTSILPFRPNCLSISTAEGPFFLYCQSYYTDDSSWISSLHSNQLFHIVLSLFLYAASGLFKLLLFLFLCRMRSFQAVVLQVLKRVVTFILSHHPLLVISVLSSCQWGGLCNHSNSDCSNIIVFFFLPSLHVETHLIYSASERHNMTSYIRGPK